MNRYLLSGILMFFSAGLFAQQKYALGTWIDYLPYANARAVTQSATKVFCSTDVSLFSVDKSDLSMEKISKCNGLNDIGYSDISYDNKRNQLIIAYNNSNIDVYRGTSTINLSELETKNIPGDKNIYNIYISGNFAYLACGFGIEVLDLDSLDFYDTYTIGSVGNNLKVNQVTTDSNYIYAATDSGLIMANINDPFLSNFNSWTKIGAASGLPSTPCQYIMTYNNVVYAAFDSTIYIDSSNSWKVFFKKNGRFQLNGLSFNNNNFYLCSHSNATDAANLDIINLKTLADNTIPGNSFLGDPIKAIVDEKGRVWIGDFYRGLSYGDLNAQNIIFPNGPANNEVWALDAYNGSIYVTPGSLLDGSFAFNKSGFFIYSNNNWNNYNGNNTSTLSKDSINDLISVSYDKFNGKTYFASFDFGGVVELGDSMRLYKRGYVSYNPQIPADFPCYSTAIDNNGNLWATNPTTAKALVFMEPNGKWGSVQLKDISSTINVAKVFTDTYNQVWVTILGDGIIVYNYGTDIESTADDQFFRINTGVGTGNLPSASVNAMVLDNNGEMWLGTDQGIAVMYCASSLQGCDAQQIIVEGADSIAGYLLSAETVTAIDIDAGDRKWVGTENGVWLFSEDGTKQIYHFTTDNSPLFSNTITSLKVDNQTGMVYIGTDKGLMAYQGDATTPSSQAQCNMLIYPNPVKHDYSGPIAFRGLPYNATLKICDVEGKLVYETTANGGTATWNGMNYKGERAHTGIYYATTSAIDSNNQQSDCISTLLFVR